MKCKGPSPDSKFLVIAARNFDDANLATRIADSNGFAAAGIEDIDGFAFGTKVNHRIILEHRDDALIAAQKIFFS